MPAAAAGPRWPRPPIGSARSWGARSGQARPARSGRSGPAHQNAASRDAESRDPDRQDVESALAQQGYEPGRDDDGVIRLRNCPFHQLAERHRDVVCHMNLALVEGLVAGLGDEGWRPVLDPRRALLRRDRR